MSAYLSVQSIACTHSTAERPLNISCVRNNPVRGVVVVSFVKIFAILF